MTARGNPAGRGRIIGIGAYHSIGAPTDRRWHRPFRGRQGL